MHADVDTPGSALNLIVVEDSELDYELLLAMLMREGLRPRAVRVEDEAGMRETFARDRVDAVITDHNLPRFDSFASLKVAKSVDPDIPVANQMLPISVQGATSAMRLKLNGEPLASADRAMLWTPRTGAYRLELEDAADKLVDSILFTVR